MRRDRSLDVLRDLFLIITIDPFAGTLRSLIWQAFGYVCAAEGFILLSGYMSGPAYGRPGYPQPTAQCLRHYAESSREGLGLRGPLIDTLATLASLTLLIVPE